MLKNASWNPWQLKALGHGFSPPKEPCMVKCLVCGEVYPSTDIRPAMAMDLGAPEAGFGWIWDCATPGCDGKGYGRNITRASRREVEAYEQSRRVNGSS